MRRARCWGYIVLGYTPPPSLEAASTAARVACPLRPVSVFSECEELKDIIESVLGETLQRKQGKLAETLTEKLR